ncbi:MAG: sialate O-acetylesterase [Clostridiales bacterium]|nr:sialate O-acetylesterase [Clostridiales bacterium]
MLTMQAGSVAEVLLDGGGAKPRKCRLTASAVFSNHMVLQRQKPIPVWGQGTPGAQVTVTLADERKTTVVGPDGCWYLTLAPREAGTGLTLTVESKGQQLTCTDVAVGEVWFAGGQSNMELPLRDCKNGRREVADSDYPSIRFYNVPQRAVLDEEAESTWKVCAPSTSGDMSAVAYFFARQLSQTQGVPVGIIGCYWGGTSISCWMSRQQLEKTAAGQKYLNDYAALVGDKTDEQYAAEMERYNAEYQAWQARIDQRRAAEPTVTWPVLNEECGLCPWPQPAGNQSPFRPAGLYETMVQRVTPYAIRGFLYYQGEEDEARHATYDVMMASLIDQWRTDWRDDELPFLFVQLPMYCSREEYQNHQDSKHWAMMRDQQMKVSRTVANTGLAVLTDCGEFDNIHPLDKQTVGHRLALQARKKVYGEDVVADAPVMAQTRPTEDGGMEVRFRHTGGGLSVRGDCLEGFQLAGADGFFYPARGSVQADRVLLHSAQVSAPVYVRYAWTNFGPATLYGASGLPAAPFRTDEFPIEG